MVDTLGGGGSLKCLRSVYRGTVRGIYMVRSILFFFLLVLPARGIVFVWIIKNRFKLRLRGYDFEDFAVTFTVGNLAPPAR